MSLLLIDGFDHYTTAELDEKAVDEREGAIIPGGRCDTFCYTNTSVGAGIQYGVDPTDGWGQVGVAYNPGATYPTSSVDLIKIGNGEGDVQCFVSVETNGALKIWSGVNQVLGTEEGATGAGKVLINDFIYIEFRFRVHNSAGELRLYVDDTQELDATGLDTKSGSTSPDWGTVIFTLGGKGCIDDCYIMDGAGSVNNTSAALGDVHVATILPESDLTKNWTPSAGTRHSDLVDDPAPDDDATYVASDTVGAIDRYGYPDLHRTSQTVHGVQTNIHARKTGAENHQIRAVIAGASFGPIKAVSSENYVFLRDMHEENPAAGAAWTLSTVNSATFGVELNS